LYGTDTMRNESRGMLAAKLTKSSAEKQVRDEFGKVRHWDMRLVQVESISG
jgi:hypothetical protein